MTPGPSVAHRGAMNDSPVPAGPVPTGPVPTAPVPTRDPRPDVLVARLATTQHGVVTRRQAMALGMTQRMIHRRVETGMWTPVLRGVYSFTGLPDSRTRRLWAAVLHAGDSGVLSLHTAGRLHGFEEIRSTELVYLNVDDVRRHPPEGVVWHRQIDMVPADVVTIDGLPVTSIPRTGMDLAGDPAMSITRLRRFVESALVHRGFEPADFGVVLSRIRRSGKPGVTRMERVLDEVGPGVDLPRSELERLLDRVIERAGLPSPRHEHPLPGAWDRPGFVDRCWPEVRLVVEADGRRWHTRRQQIATDHDRAIDAQAAGYQTTRLLWEHLHGDPEGTARRLRLVYEARLRDVGRAFP